LSLSDFAMCAPREYANLKPTRVAVTGEFVGKPQGAARFSPAGRLGKDWEAPFLPLVFAYFSWARQLAGRRPAEIVTEPNP
jgi:hypothetical protein